MNISKPGQYRRLAQVGAIHYIPIIDQNQPAPCLTVTTYLDLKDLGDHQDLVMIGMPVPSRQVYLCIKCVQTCLVEVSSDYT